MMAEEEHLSSSYRQVDAQFSNQVKIVDVFPDCFGNTGIKD